MARRTTTSKVTRKPKRPRNPVARALYSPALKPKVVTPKGRKGRYTRKGRRPTGGEDGGEA